MIVAGIPLRITSETSTDSGWSNPAAILGSPSSKSSPGDTSKSSIQAFSKNPIRAGGVRTVEATGFLGRPGPEERAENRARMIDDTGDALVKYGMVAGTLLFSPNPMMKVWALVQAFGIADEPVGE